ncbi:hypothetical protein [Streptomyces lydicus]|uniref:hypothetical protein n=1 Tax=Streptomyces lydicus TaxID=47763 RepID=UPI00379F8800
MATITGTGTVDVELTVREVDLIRRALRLVEPYGDVDDWERARDLLADLEGV